MPVGGQPRGRRGTIGHPYSALTLRLALAGFGLVFCTVGAVLLFRAGIPVAGWGFVVLAAIAAGDLVVIEARRRAARRAGR